MENPFIPFLLSAYFLFQLTITASSIHRGNETDKLSLLAFKAQVTNDPHQFLASWNDSLHFCNWSGITCGKKHQRVTSLEFQTLQLSGIVSPHIGNLSFLRILDLRNNSFTGHIPFEVGRLFRLQTLILQFNSFSGEIPRNISGCFNLLNLGLGSNTFVGRLPIELTLLSKLIRLSLPNNSFVGKISPSFGNLSSLELFATTINSFHGSIPDSFGNLKRLNTLFIGGNNLSGQIPPSIFNLSSIKYFSAPVNNLQGTLPPHLGNQLPDIEIFNLYENQFHGSIPTSISNVSKLSFFSIAKNQFIGTVPVLKNLHNLQHLSFEKNNLTNNEDWDFLSSLVNSSNLERLYLNDNNFGGMMPDFISNFSTKLVSLTFGRNKIRGNIPMEIGNLVSLEDLGMEKNELTGSIPASVGKLQKLYNLYLNENQLSGTIPNSIGNLSMLGRLNLRFNNLEGSIPLSILHCEELMEMTISHNKLNGSIPKELFKESFFAMDLSENQLIGSLPMEVGKLINLNYLNISGNQLSGEIPGSLGNCIRLETLSLRGNFIQGTIPQSLRSLRGIEAIDLSQNNLSGKILELFYSFQVLDYLNLSFNNFEGELPMQGVFKNASKFSVTGNSKLCGGIPVLKLPECKSNEPKNRLSRKLKLFIIIVSSIIGLISIVSLVALFWLRKKKSVPTRASTQPTSGLQVSYHDLFKATNGFSSSNLVGSGGFGSVYKGILDEGEKIVAVKVFNLQYRETFKSFMAECEAMRNIRHRNLVRSLTACSSIDSQGNEFLALVYEFMENGSLEDWLYPIEGSNQECLNLMQRLNIAMDVGNALEYLHNRCHIKIVHCDIKPSNILLDGDMTAHVGDFGLARFIYQVSDQFSLEQSSIGLKGSFGYAAPEYGMGSKVSSDGDIYSYGILLLEMFIGKRPTDAIFKDGLDLHNFALMGLSEGVSKVVEPKILHMQEDQNTHKLLASMIQIGVGCSLRDPRERKDINLVLAELSSIKKTFIVGRRTPERI